MLNLPRILHMEVHKVLCLIRNLHIEVHKVLFLPRHLNVMEEQTGVHRRQRINQNF